MLRDQANIPIDWNFFFSSLLSYESWYISTMLSFISPQSFKVKTKVRHSFTLLTLWQRLAYVIQSLTMLMLTVPAEACRMPLIVSRAHLSFSFLLTPLISSPSSCLNLPCPSKPTAPRRCSHHLKPCRTPRSADVNSLPCLTLSCHIFSIHHPLDWTACA